MLNVKQFGIASAITLALCGTANAASVTYDYLGNDFESFFTLDSNGITVNTSTLPATIGPRITGSATFADGIENQVTSYFLTDGINTLDTTLNSPAMGFGMTFINGNVDTWNIALSTFEIIDSTLKGNGLLSFFDGFAGRDASDKYEFINGLLVLDDRGGTLDTAGGSWSLRQEQVSAVPVPAALPLMASALGLFGFARRKFNA